jgi:hypothetical protein
LTEQDFDSDAMHWWPKGETPSDDWELRPPPEVEVWDPPPASIAPLPSQAIGGADETELDEAVRWFDEVIFNHARQVAARIYNHLNK